MELALNLIPLAIGVACIFICHHLGQERGVKGAWAYGFLCGPLGILLVLMQGDKK